MGFLDFLKRNKHRPLTDAPVTGDNESSDEGTTRIEREHFLMQVPFQWKAEPCDQPYQFEFRNQRLPEQLIVQVLLNRDPLTVDQLRPIVERLVNARTAAIAERSKGTPVMGPVDYRTGPGQIEARCSGISEADDLRFAWVIRSTPNKCVTVALTRYTVQEIGAPFDVYAGIIFDIMQIKG